MKWILALAILAAVAAFGYALVIRGAAAVVLHYQGPNEVEQAKILLSTRIMTASAIAAAASVITWIRLPG